jgi:hypothetical protein
MLRRLGGIASHGLAGVARVDPLPPDSIRMHAWPCRRHRESGRITLSEQETHSSSGLLSVRAARQQYTKPATPKRGGVFSPVVAISSPTPLTGAPAQSRLMPADMF